MKLNPRSRPAGRGLTKIMDFLEVTIIRTNVLICQIGRFLSDLAMRYQQPNGEDFPSPFYFVSSCTPPFNS